MLAEQGLESEPGIPSGLVLGDCQSSEKLVSPLGLDFVCVSDLFTS